MSPKRSFTFKKVFFTLPDVEMKDVTVSNVPSFRFNLDADVEMKDVSDDVDMEDVFDRIRERARHPKRNNFRFNPY